MEQENKKLTEELLSSWEVPRNKTRDEAWADLQEKLKSTDDTKVVSIQKKRKPWVAVASVAAVLLAVVWWNFSSGPSETSVQSLTASTEHVLPDGSKVILNASSSLNYIEDEWETNRTLKLDGEAYFDVEKGSAFTVQTTHGEVVVLGTEFNVFSRDRYIVQCFEGKVAVRSSASEGVELQAGDEVQLLSSGMMAKKSFDILDPTWKDGVFTWENADLNLVLEEVERQYGVNIEMEADSNRRYTGSFEKLGLEEVLTLICEPMGMEFQNIEGGIIRIQKNRPVNIP